MTADEAVFAGRDGSVERMRLIGVKRNVRMEPLDKQPGISNYFIGNDPSKWRTNIPNYGRVALRGVYPGIDLVFYGNERQLDTTGWSLRAPIRNRSALGWDVPAFSYRISCPPQRLSKTPGGDTSEWPTIRPLS